MGRIKKEEGEEKDELIEEVGEVRKGYAGKRIKI